MVTFFLAHKSREKSPINMLISFKGKKYKRGAGVSCLVKYWSDTKKRVKVVSGYLIGSEANKILDKLEIAGIKAMTDFKTHAYPPSDEAFFKVLDDYFYDVKDAAVEYVHLVKYFEEIYTPRYSQILGIGTQKTHNTVLGKLKEFEKYRKNKLRFEDIDIDFYNLFQEWFYKQGFSDNYLGVIIKVLKQVFREAKEVDKLHNCDGISHRRFITPKKTSDTIFLSESELSRMKELDISEQLLRLDNEEIRPSLIARKITSLTLARNTFLIGAYTGLRVSDYTKLSKANIGDNLIKIRTQKTDKDVVIPIHPIVRDILSNGFDVDQCMHDVKLNKQIKEVARLAGIKEIIKINKNVGGKVIQEEIPKYQLVTTHTARRSFVTNALIAGVSPQLLIKITGHTQESSFQKYVKMSNTLTAEILSEHPFFKEK